MKKNTKVLLGLGAGAVALWAFSKRAKGEGGVELALINTRTGESVGLEGDGIAGTISNPVEGESYKLIATVTNQSTRGAGGPMVSAYLYTILLGSYSDGSLIGEWQQDPRVLVPANTSISFESASFTIPVGKSGKYMIFEADVYASEFVASTPTLAAQSGPKNSALILSNIVFKATVTLNV